MVKKIIKGVFGILCLISTLSFAVTPDFGSDGLKNLNTEQRQRLVNGEIVFTVTDLVRQEHSGLIQAAVIFNQLPEKTWNLLNRIEDQVKYLEELEEIKVITKSPQQETVEFKARYAFLTFNYRVNLTFDKESLSLFWRLDPKFNNDLLELRGFWRFYPFGQGKTLGRYGCIISVKSIPTFIEDIFKKDLIARSLASMKKYVDSGGMEGKVDPF
ncbi:SRPBCC family protein [Nitrosomonas sp. Nm33]|uniref:SRPBCC family protein n=1 Tax=Nitrosomonas sp. Nm33 TaxID=133724 RepID=UPI0008979DD5|nr:SRPBCC family protein [Nitrosomonas sp. Nm33]SDY98651.1 hypothetical protein SAMN05421755_10777 [Nitrosomonas sp. Nm33]